MSLINSFEKKVKELEVKFLEAKNSYDNFQKVNSEFSKGRKSLNDYQNELKIFKLKTDAINNIVYLALEELKGGDKSQIVTLLAYLSIRERYFRSGYIKEKICKALKKVDFNNEEQQLLTKIIVDNITTAGREFGELIKLVPKVKKQEILTMINELKNTDQDYIQKRINKIRGFLDI